MMLESLPSPVLLLSPAVRACLAPQSHPQSSGEVLNCHQDGSEKWCLSMVLIYSLSFRAKLSTFAYIYGLSALIDHLGGPVCDVGCSQAGDGLQRWSEAADRSQRGTDKMNECGTRLGAFYRFHSFLAAACSVERVWQAFVPVQVSLHSSAHSSHAFAGRPAVAGTAVLPILTDRVSPAPIPLSEGR